MIFISYKFTKNPEMCAFFEKTSIYGHFRSKHCLKFLTFIPWFMCTKSVYLSSVKYLSSASSLDIMEYILLFIYSNSKK